MPKKTTKRKAPTKKCPKCGEVVHARKRECSKGHVFPVTTKKPARKLRAASGSLKAQLLAERSSLQKRLDAIDTLLR